MRSGGVTIAHAFSDAFCPLCGALVPHEVERGAPVAHDAPCWRPCATGVSRGAYLLGNVHRVDCFDCDELT